jgi:hypothetical protein
MEASMRIITLTLLTGLFLLGSVAPPALASGMGGGFDRGASVPAGSMLNMTRTSGPIGGLRGAAGPIKIARGPVLPMRKTTGPGCFFRIYSRLTNTGQDHELATAGAALLCGWSP